jgi:hypothetical protein
MTVAREHHTATVLPNRAVLIAGGEDGITNALSVASAERYDPTAGTFTATGKMTTARAYQTATLLPSGKVLNAGGGIGQASAELYDPAAGTFTATGSMTVARAGHTATLLPNRAVFIAGGDAAGTAELYDPTVGTFTATGTMTTSREFPTATLLPDGTVLIAGGQDSKGNLLATSELFDSSGDFHGHRQHEHCKVRTYGDVVEQREGADCRRERLQWVSRRRGAVRPDGGDVYGHRHRGDDEGVSNGDVVEQREGAHR